MKDFLPTDIARIRTISSGLSDLFDRIATVAHPLEQDSLAGEISGLIRPTPDNWAFNAAHQILDNKIEQLGADFATVTQPFYRDNDRARRAAETTDLFRSLNHQRNSLQDGPEIEQAKKLHSIFVEFLQANPPIPS